MKYTIIISIILLHINPIFSQNNKKNWSSTDRLNINDFELKITNQTSNCFGQFSIEYNVNGLDFFTKNFNTKVKNCMITSASWIDTNSDVKVSIRYQQTLFDLSEIYARYFRKELKENRKKLASGTKIVDEINQKNLTEFSKKRIEYDIETNFGMNDVKQKEWEIHILKELNELKEFEYDNR